MAHITERKPRKTRAQKSVAVIVAREFIGDKTVIDALIPVIADDLRRKAEQARTFDNQAETV